MTVLADVWVPGVPRTKGSVIPKGSYVTETPQSIRWQRLIADSVRRWRAACGLTLPSEMACAVRCVFFVPLPVDEAAWTIAATHRGAGDVDKLARNALDAAGSTAKDAAKNGGAFVDDVQVQTLQVERYAAPAQGWTIGSGLHLTVWELDDQVLADKRARAVGLAMGNIEYAP